MHPLAYLLAGFVFPFAGQCGPVSHRSGLREPVTTLYQSNSTHIENQHVLPNGHLLLSTLISGEVFTLDPSAPNPTLEKVVSLTGSTQVFGLSSAGYGLYAAAAGVLDGLVLRDPYVHVFKLDGTLVDSIPGPGPEPSFLNGLTSLPGKPYILLASDSLGGKILRFDTKTRRVTVAVDDAALKGTDDPAAEIPLGVNGIKIKGGYLYFANSYQGTYGRFKIDHDGKKIGRVEILVQLELPTLWTRLFDDFVFDYEGNVYIAQQYNTILKVTPRGATTVLPGTGQDDSKTRAPTSIGLAKDGRSIYVTTATSALTGPTFGGGVFKISIS